MTGKPRREIDDLTPEDFDRYQRIIRNLLRKKGIPEQEIDDLVQEALTRFVEEYSPDRSPPTSFIFELAKWKAQGWFREAQTGRPHTSLDLGGPDDDNRVQGPVDPAPDPRQSATEEDDEVVLEEALLSMGLPDRLVISDLVILKLTYERIAEKRGLTLNQVKTIIDRGIRYLQGAIMFHRTTHLLGRSKTLEALSMLTDIPKDMMRSFIQRHLNRKSIAQIAWEFREQGKATVTEETVQSWLRTVYKMLPGVAGVPYWNRLKAKLRIDPERDWKDPFSSGPTLGIGSG